MGKIKFNAKAIEHVSRANVSKDDASSALLILAKKLRNREIVSYELADWMADAIEASMNKEQKYRTKSFTDELGLTGNSSRRQSVSYLELGTTVDGLIDSGMSKSAALDQTAANYSIVKNTAVAAYKRWLHANKIHSAVSGLEREK